MRHFYIDCLLLSAKVIIPILFLCQLGLIPISYKWNRTAFFTTNELLLAEEFRYAQVLEWEERTADEQLADIEREKRAAMAIPIFEVGVCTLP